MFDIADGTKGEQYVRRRPNCLILPKRAFVLWSVSNGALWHPKEMNTAHARSSSPTHNIFNPLREESIYEVKKEKSEFSAWKRVQPKSESWVKGTVQYFTKLEKMVMDASADRSSAAKASMVSSKHQRLTWCELEPSWSLRWCPCISYFGLWRRWKQSDTGGIAQAGCKTKC